MAKTVGRKQLPKDDSTKSGVRTPDTKWFKTKLATLGIQIQDVAAKFGTHPNVVWRMTTARRNVKPEEIALWAEILGEPLPTVFRKFGYVWDPATVPIVGSVGPDGRVTLTVSDQRAPAPDDAPGNLAALEVSDARPALGVMRGAVLYYVPVDVIDLYAVGRLSIVGLGDQPAPIVGVLDAAALGKARVLVWGTGEVVESAQAISAAPVRWIRAG